jgi:hypothetical protein
MSSIWLLRFPEKTIESKCYGHCPDGAALAGEQGDHSIRKRVRDQFLALADHVRTAPDLSGAIAAQRTCAVSSRVRVA